MEQISGALAVFEILTKGLEAQPETKQQVIEEATRGNRICCENVPLVAVVEVRRFAPFLTNNKVFDTFELRSSASDDEKFHVTVRLSARFRSDAANTLSERTDELVQE
jgi:hypothetical protein